MKKNECFQFVGEKQIHKSLVISSGFSGTNRVDTGYFYRMINGNRIVTNLTCESQEDNSAIRSCFCQLSMEMDMIQALRKPMRSSERIAASNLRQCYQYSILSCEQVLITLTTLRVLFFPVFLGGIKGLRQT